jgi:eukaryotic-like serine/threonine-protein kinase
MHSLRPVVLFSGAAILSSGGNMGVKREAPHDKPIEGVPREGDIVGGKYRVEGLLGAGGMGVVVAAMHIDLQRRVALKFLQPAISRRTEVSTRFLREARAAVAIRSEHVATVLDVGKLESGAPYMVMEYMTGLDLRHVLAERGPLPIEEAIDYVLQASEAIAEAHSMGIVHRDLKPGNLFLTERPDGSPLVKVLDFGIAKSTDSDSPADPTGLTITGSVIGSPRYTPPERLRDAKSVDPRGDIWSLGVVLQELLTQKAPFEAPLVSALCAKIAADPPKLLREDRPDAPESLEQVILRCLEKEPDARPADMAEFAKALAPFAPPRSALSVDRIIKILGPPSDPPPEAIRPIVGQRHEHSGDHSTPNRTTRRVIPPRPGRPWSALFGATALMVSGLLAGVVLRNPHDTAPAASGPASVSTDPSPQAVPAGTATAMAIPAAPPPTEAAEAHAIDAGAAPSPPAPAGASSSRRRASPKPREPSPLQSTQKGETRRDPLGDRK